jgi:resolvase-like protein
MLHIYAALAEKERSLISERTKAGLAAAKARGQVLGNPGLAEARNVRVRRRDAWFAEHAAKIDEVVAAAVGAGAKSRDAVARALDASGIGTPEGEGLVQGDGRCLSAAWRAGGRCGSTAAGLAERDCTGVVIDLIAGQLSGCGSGMAPIRNGGKSRFLPRDNPATS